MPETVINCPRCGGCVLCGHADNCPDPSVEISGDPGKSTCAVAMADQADGATGSQCESGGSGAR